MSRRTLALLAALLAGAIAFWVARRVASRPPTDEEAIRAIFERGVRAVEERRIGDAVEDVSERFAGDGMDKREVKQTIAAIALRGEWLSLTVGGAAVEVRGDSASAVVDLVAARGKGKGLAELLPADASVQRLTVALEREEGSWRVVSASRRQVGLGEAIAGPEAAPAR